MTRYFYCWLLVGVCAATGCASTQLRRTTPRHAGTLAGIYEKQVLDNLAAFCVNKGSLPSFAVPTAGTNGITHSNTANGGLNFNPTTFTGASLGLNGTRQLGSNWTMNPITDPTRLKLMRCVFQHATCAPEDCCNDCFSQLNVFFKDETCPLPSRFFTVVDARPRVLDGCCIKYGESCGKYVVVSSKSFECLTRLTLAVLDIATISDEDLAARMTVPEKKIEITESFTVKDSNGNERVITGEYSIQAEAYKELAKTRLVPADQEGNDILERSAPLLFMPATKSRRPNIGAELESQIQFNQMLSPR